MAVDLIGFEWNARHTDRMWTNRQGQLRLYKHRFFTAEQALRQDDNDCDVSVSSSYFVFVLRQQQLQRQELVTPSAPLGLVTRSAPRAWTTAKHERQWVRRWSRRFNLQRGCFKVGPRLPLAASRLKAALPANGRRRIQKRMNPSLLVFGPSCASGSIFKPGTWVSKLNHLELWRQER